MKESNIEKLCRLKASALGLVLFRNARGYDPTNKVKYGLGPDGASDEIGFYSVTVTPEMVGESVAIFSAIEIKTPNHKTNKKRFSDQKRFIANVKRAGGIGGFATCEEDIERIIKKHFTK